MHERGSEIVVDDGAASYRGAPLVFVHFSGASADRFRVDDLSPYQMRYRAADFPNLRPLFEAYANATKAASTYSSTPYAFSTFDNGAPIPPVLRDLYKRLRPAYRQDDGRATDLGPLELAVQREVAAKNPFATAPAGSLWRWLVSHRSDHVVYAPDDWTPNACALAVRALGVDLENVDEDALKKWCASSGALALARTTDDRRHRLQFHRQLEGFPRRWGPHACCLLIYDAPCFDPGVPRHAKRLARAFEGLSAKERSRQKSTFCDALRSGDDTRPRMDLRREAVWEEALSTNWTELSARTPSTKPPFGVNVLGPIDGKSGGAESSRLLYAGLAAHVPTAAVNVLEYPRSAGPRSDILFRAGSRQHSYESRIIRGPVRGDAAAASFG